MDPGAAELSGAVCSAWMGHLVAVTEAHDQMVRDSDHDRAASTPTMTGAQAAQNAAQSPTGGNRHVPSRVAQVPANQRERPAMSEHDGFCEKSKIGATGLEPVTSAM